eukprot:gnl/MRDRNA2_/MRDRNA2_260934_c0_seq1.p1 gnl/MRDRNA2_/MRDRNA2_260934_c0~~gnl/MRDRNA2_/MRDRNA2_260934_c0_seq1.p1  ORF type:complete len:276 (-),score=32.65 gnl/MRDRNA2_/MRDRNA2_260934_c0_seq1:32-793(-)
MGLHKSGTNAMSKYLNRYFNVTIQPKIKEHYKDDAGTLCVGDLRMWKHTVPLTSIELPSGVTIVLMIREVRSWMLSLAEHSYEIYPSSMDKNSGEYNSSAKRRQGDLGWMLGRVYMRQSTHNPHSEKRFGSIPELWNHYARGYLQGKVSNHGEEHRVVIVRYEDLVKRPHEVVDELKNLGLPRNKKVFEPIRDYLSGRSVADSRTRDDIIAKLEAHARGEEISHAAKRDLKRAMSKIDKTLLDPLGYGLEHFQ